MMLSPGRTYDILALRPEASRAAPLSQNLFTGSPTLVTGVLKLAQWVIVELLTEAGSKPLAVAAGTGLLAAARAGVLRTEMAARTAFGAAAGRVLVNERGTASAGAPPDERLASLSLLSVAVLPGQVAFVATLTTTAGAARTIFVPVPTA